MIYEHLLTATIFSISEWHYSKHAYLNHWISTTHNARSNSYNMMLTPYRLNSFLMSWPVCVSHIWWSPFHPPCGLLPTGGLSQPSPWRRLTGSFNTRSLALKLPALRDTWFVFRMQRTVDFISHVLHICLSSWRGVRIAQVCRWHRASDEVLRDISERTMYHKRC